MVSSYVDVVRFSLQAERARVKAKHQKRRWKEKEERRAAAAAAAKKPKIEVKSGLESEPGHVWQQLGCLETFLTLFYLYIILSLYLEYLVPHNLLIVINLDYNYFVFVYL